eukprot:6159172-Heterocapsa_arctica.AAC.1
MQEAQQGEPASVELMFKVKKIQAILDNSLSIGEAIHSYEIDDRDLSEVQKQIWARYENPSTLVMY